MQPKFPLRSKSPLVFIPLLYTVCTKLFFFHLFSHLSSDPWWQTLDAVCLFVGLWGWAPVHPNTQGTECNRGSQLQGYPLYASWYSGDARFQHLGSLQNHVCCWDLGREAEMIKYRVYNVAAEQKNKQINPRHHLKSAPSYLDGGDECSSDVRTEPGWHCEFGYIFFFFYCSCNPLLAE